MRQIPIFKFTIRIFVLISFLWFLHPGAFAQKFVAENYKLDIRQYHIPCSGHPIGMEDKYLTDNYGMEAQMVIKADKNPANENGYCIAWLEKTTMRVHITTFSADHQFVNEFIPEFIGKTNYLGGFAVLPNGQFALGYTKDNKHGDINFEYWVCMFNDQADSIWTRRIFGDRPSDEEDSRGRPIGHCSVRMEYDDATKDIYFYLGHTKKWHDGVRHQGGYLSRIDLEGKETVIDNWFCSHNFDQRLALKDGRAYAMYHGDAYPRALGVGVYEMAKDKGRWSRALNKYDFYDIDGNSGNNYTGCKIGNVIPFENGTFGSSFNTLQNKKDWKIGYVANMWNKDKLEPERITWLEADKGNHGVLPVSVRRARGRNLVGFHEKKNDGWNYVKYSYPMKASFYEVSNTGTILTEKMQYDSVYLQRMHEPINLPNGNIVWATARKVVPDSKDWEFVVYEIDFMESNKQLYNSYSEEEYDRIYFNDSNGGFLVRSKDLKKNKKNMISVGERLAKEGDMVELYPESEKRHHKYTDCLINYETFKFLTVSKPKEKSFLKIRDELRKSSKNIVIHFKKSCDFENFKKEVEKVIEKTKNSKTIIFADPDQLLRLELPLKN